MRLVATPAGKRATERYLLAYTPVWGAAAAVVMVTGLAAQWGDVELNAFAIALCLGAVVGPLVWRAPEDRGRPWYTLYAAKYGAWMFLFAFFGNYITFYFYEILGMHYGFRTEWNPNGVPLFLYFITVPYFATYGVLLNVARRMTGSWLSGRPAWVRYAAYLPFCYAVAAGETAANANPWMTDTFCYDDLGLALGLGTAMYGSWWALVSPLWFHIDETEGDRTPWRQVLVGVLAACALVLLVNETFRQIIAPWLTTVEHGAAGLGDVEGSCLEPR